MENTKLTPKQYLKLQTDKDVMATTQIIPTKQGQVVSTLANENTAEQYLIIEMPQFKTEEDLIKVCGISELQRAQAFRREPNYDYFKLNTLTVLAEDLKSFIESFNH